MFYQMEKLRLVPKTIFWGRRKNTQDFRSCKAGEVNENDQNSYEKFIDDAWSSKTNQAQS